MDLQTWLTAHTALALALLTVTGALSSIANGAVDGTKNPRLHALLSLVAGMSPGDVMKSLDALVRMLSGAPPAPPPQPPAKPRPPAQSGDAGPFVRRAMLPAAVAASLLLGCPQAANVVPPVSNLAACVVQGAIAKQSLAQIATSCGGDLVSVIEAILASSDPAVLSSPAFVEATSLAARLAARGAK